MDSMEIKDLRCGNYFLDYAGRLCVVTPNTLTDMLTGGWSDASYIPITEEWLKQFGWENYGDSLEYWRHYDMISFEFLDQGPEYTLFDSGDLKVAFIKYVHQLQNLYFAITCRELQIDIAGHKI